MLRALAVLLAGLAVGRPAETRASSCNDEVVARIAMGPGRVCWVYHGSATTFVGAFGAHQHIEVRMKGEADEYDPTTGRDRKSILDRQPDASGPGDFFVSGEDGRLDFATPRAGTYRFGFSPCAMWNAPGTVEVCAR